MIEKAPKTDLKMNDPETYTDSFAISQVHLILPVIKKIENEYLYWDKVKYLKENKWNGVKLWEITKYKRVLQSSISWISRIQYSYNVTTNLQQKLHYLDHNFGAGLQKEQLLSELDKQQYLNNALMEESIFSSMIEGATTTRVKAKDMLRKNKSPKNKSEQMILNNYETIQYISDHKTDDISVQKLYEIHHLVTKNTLEEQKVGVFRNNNEIHVMNEITGEIVHTPPDFKLLTRLMESFCDFFNNNPKDSFIHPIVKASILHFFIGYIHPFVDGNGRTARAIFYWYLLKEGYWLVEYLSISRVIMKTKVQYEKAYIYTEIDDMDVTYFIHYQIKVLTQAFEDLKKYVSKKKKEEDKLSIFYRESNINERQAQLLFWIKENENRYFSVKEIENIFSITNQTARTDLENLVEKQILKKVYINKKAANYWKGDLFDKKFS
ncbi:Fic family protein [Aquimarina sp. BL5]|uniref:Fic family protein n=1 Tax=Aquimarina sp. BL5 TaxID=1714860 RepID=UPI000E4EC26E|nr:Fic family protein [Aquimarina sp. BL5]AXT52340.1 Fic family protein [Aquimarina sp. BL5]RKN06603.1 DeoR family transcriptional regulator [Aquimarina sp. BL5]